MDAVRRMLSGEIRFAVIPQKNTIGGPVYNDVEELLVHDNMAIVDEIELSANSSITEAKEGTEWKPAATGMLAVNA